MQPAGISIADSTNRPYRKHIKFIREKHTTPSRVYLHFSMWIRAG